ncbi:MAG: hypothetical protein Q7T05_07610 [Dehalococcoidia bacterium]|nr:hypothetical protein [Dehalococcoidia bacterium]
MLILRRRYFSGTISCKTMASYIRNHPGCRNWKLSINERRVVAQSGDFMIVQRDAFQGGDKKTTAEIVTRFGGDQENVDYFLNTTEERILGYVLLTSQREVRALAEIVHIGATRAGSLEDCSTWSNGCGKQSNIELRLATPVISRRVAAYYNYPHKY